MYDYFEEPWNADEYLDYMYDKYCKETKNPLPMNEWLKQYEVKEEE
jgi:hypothetical protein